eukprot:5946436-Prymnesium_polylepis.1
MARCRRPTSLALSSSSCLGTHWPRANRTCTMYRVSEYFPIIVIIMLCCGISADSGFSDQVLQLRPRP